MLGNDEPVELVEYRQAKKGLCFWSKKFYELWSTCQSWDNAGKITLQTLQICCEDLRIPYRRETRQIIQLIENTYRSSKNG